MADRYIDLDGIQIYGEFSVRRIPEMIAGLIPQCDEALKYSVVRVDEATKAAKKQVDKARAAGWTAEAATHQRDEKMALAEALLARFDSHLGGHDPRLVDRKRFFPRGRAHLTPRTAVAALKAIGDELKKKDHGVTDAAAWAARLAAAHEALAPLVGVIDSARGVRRGMTPEVKRARAEWLRSYQAAKRLVECVLILHGKPELLRDVFADLAVRANGKVKSAPADHPAPLPT